MNEWLWIIGGGYVQSLAVEAARRRGLKVMVSDRDTNSPGCVLADLALPIDTYDETTHVNVARLLNFKVSGVMTYGADVGPTVSAVAEALKLPAASYQAAVDARDKISMRIGAFSGLNRRHPAYWVLGVKDNPAAAAREWEAEAKSAKISAYPCVLKPAANCGGRGLVIIHKKEEWKDALAKVASHNRDNQFVLAEEYMLGARQFGVDYYVQGTELVPAMVYDRIFSEQQPDIELGAVYPFTVPEEAHEIARGLATTIGVKYGPFKVDFWDHPQYGLCVAECATRQSGGYDQFVYPLVTGAQPVELALDMAFGAFNPWRAVRQITLYGAHAAGLYAAGRIKGWAGRNDALALPGALRVFTRSEAEIQPLYDNASRPLFAAALGASQTEAWETVQRMLRRIQPIYG